MIKPPMSPSAVWGTKVTFLGLSGRFMAMTPETFFSRCDDFLRLGSVKQPKPRVRVATSMGPAGPTTLVISMKPVASCACLMRKGNVPTTSYHHGSGQWSPGPEQYHCDQLVQCILYSEKGFLGVPGRPVSQCGVNVRVMGWFYRR